MIQMLSLDMSWDFFYKGFIVLTGPLLGLISGEDIDKYGGYYTCISLLNIIAIKS